MIIIKHLIANLFSVTEADFYFRIRKKQNTRKGTLSADSVFATFYLSINTEINKTNIRL